MSKESHREGVLSLSKEENSRPESYSRGLFPFSGVGGKPKKAFLRLCVHWIP
jgi:hypothetical protein